MGERYFRERIGVYLFLEEDDKILLMLRQNTGYADGSYGTISGHLEEGETFVQGIIREALEEAGIEIEPKDLELVHIMHRLDNIQTVNVFFRCMRWKNEVRNCEPHKCAELAFFHKKQFPETCAPFILRALSLADAGVPFSEDGFLELACS